MMRAKCDQTEWSIDTFDEYILGSVFFSLSFGLQLNSQLWEKQTPTINSKLRKKKDKEKKKEVQSYYNFVTMTEVGETSATVGY